MLRYKVPWRPDTRFRQRHLLLRIKCLWMDGNSSEPDRRRCPFHGWILDGHYVGISLRNDGEIKIHPDSLADQLLDHGFSKTVFRIDKRKLRLLLILLRGRHGEIFHRMRSELIR